MQNFELQELLNKIYNNEKINRFIKEHNLSVDDVQKNIPTFLGFLASEAKCQKCQGLDKCPQSQRGKKLVLKLIKTTPDIYFESCEQLGKEEENKTHLIASGYDFSKVTKPEITEERKEILMKMKDIINKVNNNLSTKGLYIYGAHGIGKTYLLAYLAKELAKTKKKIIFAYFPDLVRKIKNSINNNKLEDVMDELKDVDILIIDDFGAETSSNFVRDEILGPILQDRMENNLLTFMSSNLDDDLLIDHLSETKDKSEILRATRIRSRMLALMDFKNLKGIDHRI